MSIHVASFGPYIGCCSKLQEAQSPALMILVSEDSPYFLISCSTERHLRGLMLASHFWFWLFALVILGQYRSPCIFSTMWPFQLPSIGVTFPTGYSHRKHLFILQMVHSDLWLTQHADGMGICVAVTFYSVMLSPIVCLISHEGLFG